MEQKNIQKTANDIAQRLLEGYPIESYKGLQNEQGLGTKLGLQVHGFLQDRSPQVAKVYYQKVLRFGT